MKLINSVLERKFTVTYKGKRYYISYLNSDGPIIGLLNRFHWEILDEELEELDIYGFKGMSKKEEELDRNAKLANKLIKLCIKHFNDYQPNYKEDC